jgi:hypothetical protein
MQHILIAAPLNYRVPAPNLRIDLHPHHASGWRSEEELAGNRRIEYRVVDIPAVSSKLVLDYHRLALNGHRYLQHLISSYLGYHGIP